MKNKFNIKLVVAWYDLWFGIFIDTKKQLVYVMVPVIGIKFSYLPILDFLWWLTPNRVGNILTRFTGLIWSRGEKNGVPFKYFFQRKININWSEND